MSCAGYFERLLRQAHEESFKKQALQEIQELKARLTKKLQKLQVQGDFHKAIRTEIQIAWLKRTEKSIKKLVET